jgi:hypothetical protein
MDSIQTIVNELNARHNIQKFDGCQEITYKGFAPVVDRCSTNAAAVRKGGLVATVQPVYVGYTVLAADVATVAKDSAKIKIISGSTGTTSKVSVHAASGARAKLLLGAGPGGDGKGTDGQSGSQGSFSGTFASQDFSTSNEDLIVVIDSVARTVRLDTKLDTIDAAIKVLAGAFVRDGQSVPAGSGGSPSGGSENVPAPGIPKNEGR